MAEKSPEEIEELLRQFREWINSQPELPNHIEDKILRRFLHGCHYDLEKTKNAFKVFISVREQCPELLSDRDPLSPQVQKMFTFLKQAQFMLSGNRKLWIWKLDDPGLQNFDTFQDAKMFFITTDMWLLFDDILEDADIVLTDTRDIISLRFFYSKFSFSIARKMMRYQQIHFHTPNSDTLYNYFTKDELPEDYGGTRGKIDDHMKKFVDNVIEKREYFLKNDLWKVRKGEEIKIKSDDSHRESLAALTID